QTASAQMQNPQGFMQLQQAMLPKFGQIGQTIMGQPMYGWIDQRNQKVTPVQTGDQMASGGGMPGANGGSVYSSLPKPQQQIVDAMIEGRQSMPSSMALKTPYWNTL